MQPLQLPLFLSHDAFKQFVGQIDLQNLPNKDLLQPSMHSPFLRLHLLLRHPLEQRIHVLPCRK